MTYGFLLPTNTPCVHLRMDHEHNGRDSKEMNTEGQTAKNRQSPAVSKIIGRVMEEHTSGITCN